MISSYGTPFIFSGSIHLAVLYKGLNPRPNPSALCRPVAEILEPLAGSAASPRQRPHGFRCAPLSRPTLSAQYKDLLQDFTVSPGKMRKKH